MITLRELDAEVCVWWMAEFYMATAPFVFVQTHLNGMGLVSGGRSTPGLSRNSVFRDAAVHLCSCESLSVITE